MFVKIKKAVKAHRLKYLTFKIRELKEVDKQLPILIEALKHMEGSDPSYRILAGSTIRTNTYSFYCLLKLIEELTASYNYNRSFKFNKRYASTFNELYDLPTWLLDEPTLNGIKSDQLIEILNNRLIHLSECVNAMDASRQDYVNRLLKPIVNTICELIEVFLVTEVTQNGKKKA